MNKSSPNHRLSVMKTNIIPLSLSLVLALIRLYITSKSKNQLASNKEPTTEIKCTLVLPYVKGLYEPLHRCLEQHGIRSVFKSNTTLRSHLVRPKDAVDPRKQDGVVYGINYECSK